MRIFQLASAFVIPVIGLLTLAPSSASAAPSAAMPVAKRGPKRPASGPAILPAPSVSSLPPLPPAPRDVTSITTMLPASIADAPNAGSATGAAVTLTSAAPEALAPLPSPGLSVTAPPARETVTAEGNPIPEVKPTGFVLQLGSGGLVPTSAFVSGLKTLGPGISFDVRLGYYATPHFGILVGFRGSYGHEMSGCGGSCKGGYSLQAPVMLQFISKDRTRGLYAELGLGLATTYAGSIGSSGSYALSSPVEMKTGLGYRFGGAGGASSSASVDLNLGVDIGAITSEEVRSEGTTFTAKESGPTHVVMAMSAILHFSL